MGGDTRIRIVTIAGALAVVFLILELVRRRRLKEEYSVLWVVTSLVVLVLSVWYGALEGITELIGGTLPSSTLFFFGLLFVLVLSLHFSVRISALERIVTTLVQEMALMNVQEEPSELFSHARGHVVEHPQAEREREDDDHDRD